MRKRFFRLMLPMLACLTLILGCFRKEPNVGVGGYVREFGTDKPIPNARVYAIDCQGELLGSIQCFRADSTRTDDNGDYFMPKQPEWISATASNYWESEHLAPVLYQKELETNVSLYPFAWLKVTIRNESGAYLFSGPGSDTQSSSSSYTLSQGLDTTVVHFRRGNQDYNYVFAIFPVANQPSLQDLQSVYVYTGDSTRLTPLSGLAGSSFNIYLIGHDTTAITITY